MENKYNNVETIANSLSNYYAINRLTNPEFETDYTKKQNNGKSENLKKAAYITSLVAALNLATPNYANAGVIQEITNFFLQVPNAIIEYSVRIAEKLAELPFRFGGKIIDESEKFYDEKLEKKIKDNKKKFDKLSEDYVLHREQKWVKDKKKKLDESFTLYDSILKNPYATQTWKHGRYVTVAKVEEAEPVSYTPGKSKAQKLKELRARMKKK